MIGPDGGVVVVSQRGDSWSLPKGHVDPGEDDETAARREILEETGLKELTLVRKLGEYERYKIGKGGVSDDESELKTMVFFLFTTTQTDLKPMDPQNPEARWVPKENVADMLTSPKDKAFFSGIVGSI